jgi:hypothetical protein
MRLFPSPLRKLLLACDSSMAVAFLNTFSHAIVKANGFFILVLHSGCKGKCDVGQKFKLIWERRKCYIISNVLRRWGGYGLILTERCCLYRLYTYESMQKNQRHHLIKLVMILTATGIHQPKSKLTKATEALATCCPTLCSIKKVRESQKVN